MLGRIHKKTGCGETDSWHDALVWASDVVRALKPTEQRHALAVREGHTLPLATVPLQ